MRDQNRASGRAETSVIEMGPPVDTGRPRARAVGFIAVFAVGVAVGFVIDHRAAPTARVASVRVATTPVRGEVTWGTGTCGSVGGGGLDVGMEITNYASVPVMLTGATVTLPPNGLRLKSTNWAECGDGPALAGVATLPPGASGWISVDTDVTGCLSKPHITIAVSYLVGGQTKSLPVATYDDVALPTHIGARASCRRLGSDLPAGYPERWNSTRDAR